MQGIQGFKSTWSWLHVEEKLEVTDSIEMNQKSLSIKRSYMQHKDSKLVQRVKLRQQYLDFGFDSVLYTHVHIDWIDTTLILQVSSQSVMETILHNWRMFIIHSLEMLLSAAVWMKGRIQEFFLIFHYILVNNASILMKKRKIGGWHLGLHRGECVTVASYFLLFTISLVFYLYIY